METKRSEQDFQPWSISTIDDALGESSYNDTCDLGPGSTCDDEASHRQSSDDGGSTAPASASSSDRAPLSDDRVLELSEDETDPGDIGRRDPNGTFVWNPQDTRLSVLASTAGPFESASLTANPSPIEAVPGFEILSELGRGGMGVVYKARQLRLKRLVALKVIRHGRHANSEDLARFEIEAEVVARLNHPNIVRIYDIGRAIGVPYVALELLEGGTLKDRLASTPQPVRESAALLSTLARAVHAAHAAGVLHRDLKPSNVLFDRHDVPKIADFGLAKRLDVEESETITGQVIGTPSYMAPEQAQGWVREIGQAADIYSLGAILYEMLTGRPPIKGASQAETIKLVLESEPVSPSSLRPKVPFDLETICLKCLARDPRKRYADALGLALDLDRFLAGEPVLARRTPLWERAIKLVHRHPVKSVVLAMGMVAIGAASGAVHHIQKRENDRIRRAQKLENDRIVSVVQTADEGVFKAQGALAQEHWADVRRIVSGLLSRIETERDDRLVKLRQRAENLDEQARRGLAEQTAAKEAQDRIGRFRELLDEAHFLDTRFGGLDRQNGLETTCSTARAGLEVFGVGATGDLWTLEPPSALTREEQDEVANGFYELLLILADAVSQSPAAEPAPRAEQALRIIDRAPAVRSGATRAYHLRRSAYLDVKGDRDAAARERDLAEGVAPVEAFDLFLAGRELSRRSDWKGAMPYFEAAAHKQPNHFWAQCLLAICHFQIDEPPLARLGFTACLKQKPDRVWLYLLRGLASAAEGKRVRNMAQLLPEQAAWLSAIASKRFELADADYRQALALLGHSARDADLHYALLVNRGMIQFERRDLSAAAADLEAAIRLNDRRFEAFSGLANVYRRQHRTDDALEQVAKAIQLEPTLAELHRARADLLLGLEYSDLRNVGLRALDDQLGKLTPERRDAALHALELANSYESPEKPELTALDMTKQAAVFRVAHRHLEALKACDKALEIAPKISLAHHVRVHELLDLKRHDELLRACDLALSAIKPSAELHMLRGMAKDGLEDYSGAIADYTVALSLQPETPHVRCRRGWSNLANDANRPAFRDFDDAVGLDPNDADAFSGRGLARARLGAYEGAVSDAERSRDVDKKDWRIAYNAACIYAQSAVAVNLEPRKAGPPAVRRATYYLERAFSLVRIALELAPVDQRAILQQSISKDPALQPIRNRLKSLDGIKFEQPSRPDSPRPPPADRGCPRPDMVPHTATVASM